MKKQKKSEKGSSVFLYRSGWMIIDCSSATGGIQYDREVHKERAINHGNGVHTEYVTQKTVDHREFCAAADALVKKVDYVLRSNCARTKLGWFADDTALIEIKKQVAGLTREAEILNTTTAEEAGSARRVTISVVPLKLDFNQHETVKEIVNTIRTGLTGYRDALRQGDLAALHTHKMRTLRLEQLATGFQSEAIRYALQRVPAAAAEVRHALKEGKTAKQAGQALDLEVFDAALAHFEDSSYSNAPYEIQL